MEKSTFGEHLRREREMRGVSLEEISKATRIGVRFLEALEHEQWDRLPGGVFNRGFIRAVARFLGLDEDSLISEYALSTNDRPEKAVWVVAPQEKSPTEPQRRRGLAWAALLLILGALGAAGWWVWQEYGETLRTWRNPLPAPPPLKAPAAPPEIVAGGTPPAGSGESSASSDASNPEFLELKVEASKSTDVSVVSDGTKLFEGRMRAGSTQTFRAKDRFEVSAANSNAVFLELNGQLAPALGQPGKPGKVTLTRKDLRKP